MPLDIQVGTLADRLRNLLLLRGRIPLRLDETAVPVAIAADAGHVPYALDPVHFSQLLTSAAVAAQNSAIAVALPTTALQSCMVIDRVTVLNSGAVGASVDILVDHITLLLAAGLTDFGPVFRVHNLNPQTLLANVVQLTAPHFLVGSQAGIHLGATTDGRSLLADTTNVVEGPWVLPAGGAIAVWHRTVNTRLDVSIRGRFFPGVVG